MQLLQTVVVGGFRLDRRPVLDRRAILVHDSLTCLLRRHHALRSGPMSLLSVGCEHVVAALRAQSASARLSGILLASTPLRPLRALLILVLVIAISRHPLPLLQSKNLRVYFPEPMPALGASEIWSISELFISDSLEISVKRTRFFESFDGNPRRNVGNFKKNGPIFIRVHAPTLVWHGC